MQRADFRKAVRLSSSVQRRLNVYALAAGAAGASGFVLAPPAQGEIVYTPANHVIGHGEAYPLDLNHDGQADFWIHHRSSYSTSGHVASIYVKGPPSNSVEGEASGFNFLGAALRDGALIPTGKLGKRAQLEFACSGFFSCPRTTYQRGRWYDVTRYLGLKFVIQGQVHYGWAHLSVHFTWPSYLGVVLTGYAYETTPNTPIVAGHTMARRINRKDAANPTGIPVNRDARASLGALALGSLGLSIWKRDESDGSTKQRG